MQYEEIEIQRYYSNRHQTAFVTIGQPKTAIQVCERLEWLLSKWGVERPKEITASYVADPERWGTVIVKFRMHPVHVFDKVGGEWQILDGNDDLVRSLKVLPK